MLIFYKYITATLALAGCLSLVVTGELNPVFVLPGLMILPGYYRYVTGRQPVSRWLIAGLAVVEVLVLAFDMLFVTDDFLIAIAHMTIIFQALKSFDMREPWDPLQVYFMSILQMIITSELSLSVLVGVAFAFFTIVFMAAMVFSHFMKVGTLEKVNFYRPLVLISLGALVLAVVFFVSVPRVQGGLWGRKAATGIRTVGFSDGVDLGTFGQILEDSTIAFRAEIKGGRLPLYWRGNALDYFDGRRWTDTQKYTIRVIRKGNDYELPLPYSIRRKTGRVEQVIVVEPMDTEVIFSLGLAESMSIRGWRVSRTMDDTIYIPDKQNRRMTYTVRSLPENGRPFYRTKADIYLQLPEGTERLGVLARDVTANAANDLQRARAILQYFALNFRYTLSPPPVPDGEMPVDWFLFESRQGFCEHYSTAMVLMLRSMGIHARIVTGFLGGETSDDGGYVIVRQRDAHSWVEAAVDGYWMRFDPTPPVSRASESFIAAFMDTVRLNWYRYVVGFSAEDQRNLVSALGAPISQDKDNDAFGIGIRPIYLLIAAITLVVILIVVVVWRAPRSEPSYASLLYLELCAWLRKKGSTVNETSPASQVLREAIRLGAHKEHASEFIDLYHKTRFGGHRLSQIERLRLKELLNISIS